MLIACEIVVATAADQTPQWKTAMNSRSRTILVSEDKIR